MLEHFSHSTNSTFLIAFNINDEAGQLQRVLFVRPGFLSLDVQFYLPC